MATTVSHRLPTAQAHALAQLTGYEDPDVLRWQQACVQAAEALRPQHDAQRLAKALALAQDGYVALGADGATTVTSGQVAYHIQADGTCSCLDAQHRGTVCKHRLALQIHQHAVTLLTPAASASSQPAAAPQPEAPAKRHARPRRSAAWDVQEAPVSSCFKIRVGTLEWMHTIRASDDAELHTRLQAFLPTFREIAATLEALHAEREAAKAASVTPTPPAPPSALAPADLPALIQQAVQQALAAQHPSNGTPPVHDMVASTLPAAPSQAPTATDAAPICPLHHVAMERRSNARGSWHSHWLADEQRYCKGKA